MPTDAERSGEGHAENASHFVVRIDDNHYVICERVLTLKPEAEGDRDFLQSLIQHYLRDSALAAAALPGWSFGAGGEPCPPTMRTTAAQTGSFRSYEAQTGKYVVNITFGDGK